MAPLFHAADAVFSSPRLQLALLVITFVAVCLILSDGVLTPAISIVSAVQGIQFQTNISNSA